MTSSRRPPPAGTGAGPPDHVVIAPDRHAWADTGPEPVGPGVHRLPLPLPNDGLRAVNVYVVDLPDGVALIDGGWATPDSLRSLETGLAALGRALGDVRTVLVTHIHRDHYTQAVRLRQKVGTRVLLGAGEAPGLRMLHRIGTSVPMTALHELRRAGAGDLAERILRRLGRNDDFDPTLWEDPDSWLGPGVTDLGGRALRVIPTPGHTRGHVVFLDERERLLFAGDHVLPHITPSIGFELSAAGGMPLADFLDSLQLLRGFADVRLLPAHGAVGASVHGRVEELLAHHEDRLAACLEAVAVRQEATGAEVAGALRWTGRRTRLADLDDFNQMLAVCETAAHLEVLVLRGLLDARTDPVSEPAVARYRPTH